MQFDNDSVNVSGVDDRRGRGAAPMVLGGGGLGVVGLVIYVLVQVLGGGGSGGVGTDPGSLGLGPGLGTQSSVQAANGETAEAFSARCNTKGALDTDDDCFLTKIYDEVNEVWTTELPKHGTAYVDPKLAFFTSETSTACGTASADVGPFYCPGDHEIYIDLGFLAELQKRFGANGRYAQAYILAHEAGHHLQYLLGTEAKMRAAQQRTPSKANVYSVALELQADCYAGAWGRLANDSGKVKIDPSELQQALDAASAVGDDRIQKAATGRVDPESWTHGSAEQRKSWYQKGYDTADIDACTTFAGI